MYGWERHSLMFGMGRLLVCVCNKVCLCICMYIYIHILIFTSFSYRICIIISKLRSFQNWSSGTLTLEQFQGSKTCWESGKGTELAETSFEAVFGSLVRINVEP